MRFIYKMLLGLILFNACLFLFSNFFTDTTPYGMNVADELSEKYSMTGGEDFFSTAVGQTVLVGIGVFAGAFALGIVSRQVGLFLGIGLFASIISGLWAYTQGTITKLIPGTSEYIIIHGLIDVITIAIGIIVVFTIAEFFVAQRGAG